MKKDCKKVLKWSHIKCDAELGANTFLLYYEDGVDIVEFSEYSNSNGILKFTTGDSSKGIHSETFFEDDFFNCILRFEDSLPFNTVLEG
jgi:hypothetical protein